MTVQFGKDYSSMKKLFISITLAVIACLCMFSFTSCVESMIQDKEKAFINDFFAAISDENYSEAETFLHPERPADLETFFLNVEDKTDIDFQNGIEIEKYTGVSSAKYDSTVNGSTCEITLRANVGNEKVTFIIEIVNNDNGYGIYNLDVESKKP